MTNRDVLTALEDRVYRRATSDGMIDLFYGLFLVCLGTVWIWQSDFSVFAILLPAGLIPIGIATRSRFVERRLGYVKWAEPRRKLEQRDWTTLLVSGVLLFLVAMTFSFVGNRSDVSTDILEAVAPGIMGWLLAMGAFAVAGALRTRRFLAYGSLLAAAAAMTVLRNSEPGWSILVCGLVVVAAGVVMLVRFARDYPVPAGE